MKNNSLLKIVLVAVVSAVVVTVILKLLGVENTSALAGGAAGGITAVLVSALNKKK